jgi:hypothetical protein
MRQSIVSRSIAVVILLGISQLSLAGGHNQAENWYGTLTLGWHDWADAGDIEVDPIFTGPFSSGEFDSDGFNLEFSLHRLTAPGSSWMFGGTLGFLSNESDALGVVRREDLTLGMLYFAPSVKIRLRDTPGQRIYLDAGAGYYAASITEYDSYCYYYYCGSTEYWDDSAFGGFVGLSADIDIGQPGGSYFNFGFKIHEADFSAPAEIGASEDLGGPIWQIQLGFGFGSW